MPRKRERRASKQRGVRRLADGRWRVRVYATDTRTGRARETQRTLPAAWTEAAVLVEVARLKDELSRGGAPPPPTRIRLKHCAERWLEDVAARNKRSTAEFYLDILAKRVVPVLGELYVDALARRDIREWVRWAEVQRTERDGEPYARETVRGWWRVLTQFVRDVCAEHDVPDPIVRVRPPRGRKGRTREMRTLTVDELGRLVRAARVRVPERYAEIYMLAFTGMRAGELFALTWGDVDAGRGRIMIRQGVRRGTIDTPKTGVEREVGLTSDMSAVLQSHRRWLVDRAHPGLASGLVFPSNVGTPRAPESLHTPLLKACGVAQIDVRVGPQVLRRTFNTLMIEQKVDRVVLRSQMGHCSEQMTERYAGVGVEAKRAAIEGLERTIFRRVSSQRVGHVGVEGPAVGGDASLRANRKL